MTTTEATPAKRRPRRKPAALPVFAAMAAIFLATFAFLLFELIGGRDPALGAGALASARPERPELIIRKVIKRKVITTVVPESQSAASSGSTGGYVQGYSGSTYSAPAATTTAPAPAPAPAPVVSSAS